MGKVTIYIMWPLRAYWLKILSWKTHSFAFKLCLLLKWKYLWITSDWLHHSLTWEHIVMGCGERSGKRWVEGWEVVAKVRNTLSRASCRQWQLDKNCQFDLLSFKRKLLKTETNHLIFYPFPPDYPAEELLGSSWPMMLAPEWRRKQREIHLIARETAWWSRLALRVRALRSSLRIFLWLAVKPPASLQTALASLYVKPW